MMHNGTFNIYLFLSVGGKIATINFIYLSYFCFIVYEILYAYTKCCETALLYFRVRVS